MEAQVEESHVQATPGEAEFPPLASNADRYLPDLGDAFAASRPSEDNSPNTSKGCSTAFLADEHTSSSLGVLAQAASQQAVGDYLPDAPESARLGTAFVQTGNPDVMLGDHEASQSNCSTTPRWGKGETNTGILMGEEELFSFQD